MLSKFKLVYKNCYYPKRANFESKERLRKKLTEKRMANSRIKMYLLEIDNNIDLLAKSSQMSDTKSMFRNFSPFL